MASERGIERLTGGLLVASFVALLGHGATLLTLGAGSATILFVLIYGLLIGWSAMSLYATFRSHGEILALFGAFGLAAHGLFIVLTCVLILGGVEFGRGFSAMGGTDSGSASEAALALQITMDKVRTSSFLFLGLGLLPLGVLIASSGVVNRWIGWLGIVGGTLGFLGILAALFNVSAGPASTLVSVGSLSIFAFLLVLGIRLLGGRTQPAIT